MQEKKEYTPEEIAELEAKAAKFDAIKKMRKRVLIGGGVFAGMFVAGALATKTNEETVENEEHEEADEIIVNDAVTIEINDSSVDIIPSEDISAE